MFRLTTRTALVIPAAYHSAKSHTGDIDGGANATAIAHVVKAMDSTRSELGLEMLDENSYEGLKTISRGTAIILLLVYVAYLFFQVSSYTP